MEDRMHSAPPPDPFALELTWPGLVGRLVEPITRFVLSRVLSLGRLTAIYREAFDEPGSGFPEKVLHRLGVIVRVSDAELKQVPTAGPLLFVANHPFGALEGLVLAQILDRVRPGSRLLANFVLGRIPELRERMFLVDPFGGEGSADRNLKPLRDALRWLEGGGAIGVFPAGEVAHWSARRGTISDPPWSPTVGRLAQRAACPVVPVYFCGRNSSWFHVAGLLHPRLRTLLLPREFLNKEGARVDVQIGAAIPFERLRRFDDARDLTDYLRLRTYLLKGRSPVQSVDRVVRTATSVAPAADAGFGSGNRSIGRMEPVAQHPEDRGALLGDLRSLPEDRRLVSGGEYCVWCAAGREIPAVVREIGRLRELTFRRVGEGTGRARDVDRFDESYWHLILWHEREDRIIGAYRLGRTDEILPSKGIEGLYTSTLFRYRRALFERIHPALELGRSFIVEEHQRSYGGLMLLWKGIAAFVSRHPQYRRLFGAVSISAEYRTMTQILLQRFLTANHMDAGLGSLATPRHPPSRRPRELRGGEWGARQLSLAARTLDDVDELVADLEQSERGVPILLRQYLRLGGKVLGFNVDPDFGHVLDALMLVDLVRVDRAILNRFFGAAAAGAFLSFHEDGGARVSDAARSLS